MSKPTPDTREHIASEVAEVLQEPPMYKVLLHNDDYTTKEFVVNVLMTVFRKSREEAVRIMWYVHKNGIGLCGIFPYEIAETKVNMVGSLAKERGFPLKTSMEVE